MATVEQLKAIRNAVTRATRDAPAALGVFQVLLMELTMLEEGLESLSLTTPRDAQDQISRLIQLVNGLQSSLYDGIYDPAARVH